MMKTIRMRNRALILLVVCSVGVILLMRGLGADDSTLEPSDRKIQSGKRDFNGAPVDDFANIPPAHENEDSEKGGNPETHSELRPRKAMNRKDRRRMNARAREIHEQMEAEKKNEDENGDLRYNNNVIEGQEGGKNPVQPPLQPGQQYPDFGPGPNKNNNPKGIIQKPVPGDGVSGGQYPRLENGKFIPGHRIVHFDLKGAAPKVTYFKDVFKLLKDLGATGLLIEWEDMFPFKGRLAAVKNSFAYSEADVKQILQWAKDLNLDIIPLVQTFGHLEYILKLPQFAQFRQVDRYPQVICMGDEEAVGLVKEAVDQVMAIHSQFPLSYFHIGADEAFQIGMCQADQTVMRKELQNSRERLMLRHIARISKFVRDKYGAKVLMWHDMLNNVDSQMIKDFDLGNLAEPVVWAYAENLNEYLMPDMWQRFSESFPFIWGGSSYKGADGPSRYWSNVPHYLANHLSWVQQMTRQYRDFKEFRGLILTGWQRFDHFAVLCEIIPVGLPSAAINLQTIARGQFDTVAKKEASRIMGCSSTFDVDSSGVGGYCSFPGAKVYQAVQQLKMTLLSIDQNIHQDYQVQGWLSRFNIRHNYSSPWYLDQIMDKLGMYHQDLTAIARSLRLALSAIFFPDMVDEFMYEYVEPELDKLNEMAESAKRIGAIRTFPLRAFPINGSGSLWKPLSKKTPVRVQDELSAIFFPDMVDEFMYEYVEPELDKLNEMAESAKRIGNIRTFPLRAFPIKGSGSLWKPLSKKTPVRVE